MSDASTPFGQTVRPEDRGDRVRRLWKLLGGMTAAVPLEAEAVPCPAGDRPWEQHRVSFQAEVGVRVPAWFISPHRSGCSTGPLRRPTILYLHSHSGDHVTGKDELFHGKRRVPAGLADRFTALGFNVLAADFRCFGERSDEKEEESARAHLLHGRTLWGRMLQDQVRALDYLVSRPEVDPERIGCFGFSMGSTAAWWLSALDDRLTAGAGLCCLSSYTAMQARGVLHRHGIYYFVPGAASGLDVHDIVSLISPRPFLFVNGELDEASPVEGARDTVDRATAAYRRDGAGDRLRLTVVPGVGHEMTSGMLDEALGWLSRWL